MSNTLHAFFIILGVGIGFELATISVAKVVALVANIESQTRTTVASEVASETLADEVSSEILATIASKLGTEAGANTVALKILGTCKAHCHNCCKDQWKLHVVVIWSSCS